MRPARRSPAHRARWGPFSSTTGWWFPGRVGKRSAHLAWCASREEGDKPVRRILFACAGALLTAGCGRTEQTVASVPPATDSGPSGAGSVELSIRGVNAQGLSSVSLRIERVSVTIDGLAASVALRETAPPLAS